MRVFLSLVFYLTSSVLGFELRDTYEHLDEVEAAVGPEAFEKVRFDYLLELVKEFGIIDHFNISPEALIEHTKLTEKEAGNFYQGSSLSDELVKRYLLPFRIRYESSAQPRWRQRLNEVFTPIVKESKSADEAAGLICAWMNESFTILKPATSYPLSIRGDLDPITVLRGKHGREIDLAIFGVAAFRSIGIPARLVWAPALRDEIGGKVWLEYLSEKKEWQTWVPSFRESKNHRLKLIKDYGEKIVFLFANPRSPIEVTQSYVEVVDLHIQSSGEDVHCGILVKGSEDLHLSRDSSLLDQQPASSNFFFRVGRGEIILSVGTVNNEFSLTPMNLPPNVKKVEVSLKGVRAVVTKKFEEENR